MRQISLNDYLKLKHPEFFNKPKKQSKILPYWFKGCSFKPQLDYFKISCVGHSATVMYYVELDLNNSNDIYHYTVLYECNYFEQGTFVFTGVFEFGRLLTFDIFIRDLVCCKLCDLYGKRVPIFREAIIFNRI